VKHIKIEIKKKYEIYLILLMKSVKLCDFHWKKLKNFEKKKIKNGDDLKKELF
jgi:hypothetical protein